MNILIVKLSAIGDVIHTLPLLTALRRGFPAADITWVVEEASADLLTGNPALNRVIVSHRKTWLQQCRRGHIAVPLRQMKAFIRELRNRPYDLVIDVHGLLKSAVIVALSGGQRKLGYDSLQELSGFFYNEKVHEDMGKHAVDRYLDFVRYLLGDQAAGAMKTSPIFTIDIGAEERHKVKTLLDHHTEIQGIAEGRGAKRFPSGKDEIEGLPFVAVSPMAFWETKLWEEERFATLCDRIHRELGIGVVMTGGDAGPLSSIQSRMETQAINLGGQTSLRELALLYQQAALLITTDSGPMHLAAAMGTPVVALFGPTDPGRTGPYGTGHRVIRSRLPCVPCFQKKCKTKACMKSITVEEVFRAVKEILCEKGLLEKKGAGQRPCRPREGGNHGNQ